MNAPIKYISKFVPNADEAFRALRDELQWERRDTTPRSEYYCNDTPTSFASQRPTRRCRECRGSCSNLHLMTLCLSM